LPFTAAFDYVFDRTQERDAGMTLRTHSQDRFAAGSAARTAMACAALMTTTTMMITPCQTGPGRTRAR